LNKFSAMTGLVTKMPSKPRAAAAALLRSLGVAQTPIDVDEIARRVGIQVVRQQFADGEVSGMLFREKGKQPIIGVNASQAQTRQRFTLAHELGHWQLHPGRVVILDRPVRINRRDSLSSMATDREEIEANDFAANLLMPEEAVHTYLSQLPPAIRHDSDACADWLAAEFNVSFAAMGFRLMNLGLAT
jgi:Zn-dependent peptidase ImmA (M78 family)